MAEASVTLVSTYERARLGAIRPRPERTASSLLDELPVFAAALGSSIDELERVVCERSFGHALGATLPAEVMRDMSAWRRTGARRPWLLLRAFSAPFWRRANLEPLRRIPAHERRRLLSWQRGMALAAVGALASTSALDELREGLTRLADGRLEAAPDGVTALASPIAPMWRRMGTATAVTRRGLTIVLALAQQRRQRHARGEVLSLSDIERVVPTYERVVLRQAPSASGERLIEVTDWWWQARRRVEARYGRPIERLCPDIAALLESRSLPSVTSPLDAPLLRAQRGLL